MTYRRNLLVSRSLLFVAISMLILLLVACASSPTSEAEGTTASNATSEVVTESEPGTETEDDTIYLGAVWPMTGPNASFGEWLNEAAAIAIEEINASGGVNGKDLALIIEDSKGQAQDGVAAFTKLATVDEVPVILEIISGVVLPSMPIALQEEVILMDTASQSPQMRDQGNEYVFSLYPKADLTGPAAANFAYNVMNARTIAFMVTNIEFGRNLTLATKEAWLELGGEVVLEEYHEQDQTDFRAQIVKLRDADPDLVVLFGSLQPLSFIARQMDQVGYRPPILDTDSLFNDDYISIAGEEVANGTLISVAGYNPLDTTDIAVNYRQKFEERTGVTAEYAGATVYDAVYIIAEAMERCGCEDSEGVRDALNSITDFPGVTGSSTFDEDGIVIKPVRVFQYQSGDWVLIGEFDGSEWSVQGEMIER